MARIDLIDGITPEPARLDLRQVSGAMLRWSGVALVAVVWTSATLFGLYILAFYAGALAEGEMARWNGVLPGLYDRSAPAATSGIGLHFAAGGVILVLGCIQLLGAVRRRLPVLHRWTGRVYVAASLLAAAGGLTFIAVSGTIGGTVMDAGFSLYGVLMIVAAVQAYRHARRRRLEAPAPGRCASSPWPWAPGSIAWTTASGCCSPTGPATHRTSRGPSTA